MIFGDHMKKDRDPKYKNRQELSPDFVGGWSLVSPAQKGLDAERGDWDRDLAKSNICGFYI